MRYAPLGYRWAGVDSAKEQKKLEARKLLAVGAAESPASSARCVGQFYFNSDIKTNGRSMIT